MNGYEAVERYGWLVAFAVVVFLLLEIVRNLMAIKKATGGAYNLLRGVGNERENDDRGETAGMG